MLVADALLVAAVWLDAVLATPPRAPNLSVFRDAPPAFSVGRAGDVSYRWVNATKRRARLHVREVRPAVLGGTQPPHSVTVPPHAEMREAVSVHPVRRGREQAGSGFAADSIGPLGLGRRRGVITIPWDAAVYPPLVTVRLRASVARAQRRHEQGITPLRRLGEGRLFESLREWGPGDDLRHIDWKATARRGKVITRQYEAERRQHVLLVLDLGRLMTAEAAGVSRLDHVVRAALELAYTAVQHDDNVGVMAFAAGVQHFVVPQRGRRALKRVLDVLARVEPQLVEPDYPGAFRYLAAHNRKRALTVLFSDVIDRFASDALVANVASLKSTRSEEHTSELQSHHDLVCRLLLEKKNHLAQVKSLIVPSVTSSMYFNGERKKLSETARELSVDAMFEPIMERTGVRLLVTFQLMHA